MGFNSGFKGLIRIPTRGDRLWCFFLINYASNNTFRFSLLHSAYLDILLLQVTSRKRMKFYRLLRGTKKSKSSVRTKTFFALILELISAECCPLLWWWYSNKANRCWNVWTRQIIGKWPLPAHISEVTLYWYLIKRHVVHMAVCKTQNLYTKFTNVKEIKKAYFSLQI
jgi:hypothetical protein